MLITLLTGLSPPKVFSYHGGTEPCLPRPPGTSITLMRATLRLPFSAHRNMTKSRLEAFSDGVIAILITIMVLELHTPPSADLSGLLEILPTVGLYALSFVYLGIYWNNHHHLLHATSQINGTVLWANLHLLFWLSLIPFSMRWMGESGLAPLPTAAYGAVLLLAGAAYTILVRCLLACQPPNSILASAIGSDRKGYISLVLYALALPLTLV